MLFFYKEFFFKKQDPQGLREKKLLIRKKIKTTPPRGVHFFATTRPHILPALSRV
jgi:hypothetical protein